MIDVEALQKCAQEAGFTTAALLDVSTLEFLQEVRDMCASDKCSKYNRSWMCPPACGSLEEMRERVKKYRYGILVQSVGQLEDSYDWEGITALGSRHAESFNRLRAALTPLYPNMFPMSAGGCTRCQECTYPAAPCRFPDTATASMEACGLLISKVCADNGVKYYYGKDTLAYNACFLLC